VYIYELGCELTIQDIMPYCFYLKKREKNKNKKEEKKEREKKAKRGKKKMNLNKRHNRLNSFISCGECFVVRD